MAENTWLQLLEAAQRFRVWADSYQHEPRSGEWECDYEEWATIHTAFVKFLETSEFQDWNPEVVSTVLYLIARDNEIGHLASELAREGVRTFVEVGPGNVLSGLLRRIDNTAKAIPVNNLAGLKKLEDELATT